MFFIYLYLMLAREIEKERKNGEFLTIEANKNKVK